MPPLFAVILFRYFCFTFLIHLYMLSFYFTFQILLFYFRLFILPLYFAILFCHCISPCYFVHLSSPFYFISPSFFALLFYFAILFHPLFYFVILFHPLFYFAILFALLFCLFFYIYIFKCKLVSAFLYQVLIQIYFFRTRGWIHHTTTLHTSRDSQRLTTHETWNPTLHTFHNDSQRLTTTQSDSQRLTATHNDSQRLTSHKVNLKSLTTHTTHTTHESLVLNVCIWLLYYLQTILSYNTSFGISEDNNNRQNFGFNAVYFKRQLIFHKEWVLSLSQSHPYKVLTTCMQQFKVKYIPQTLRDYK